MAHVLLLGSPDGRPLLAVELAVDLVLLMLLRGTTRGAGIGAGRELVLALTVAVWLAPDGLWSGHPVEVVIPLLWLAAGAAAARSHAFRCGALLGVSVLVAPWAILAAPIALMLRVQAVRAAAAGVIVIAAGYLPFAFSGHFDMFANFWRIDSRTLVHLLDPSATHFSWPLRLLQAAVAGGGCLLVAYWRRGTIDAQWRRR